VYEFQIKASEYTDIETDAANGDPIDQKSISTLQMFARI
jgi:hypothetical protein